MTIFRTLAVMVGSHMPLCRILFLNILLLTLCGACKDDDDPGMALEEIRLSFYDSAVWIHAMPPAAMRAVNEPAVRRTMDYLTWANKLVSSNTNLHLRYDRSKVVVVDTAVMAAEPGVRYRTSLPLVLDAATSEIWDTKAHQASIQQGRYVLESFGVNSINPIRWVRRAIAEERIDGAAGQMRLYASVYEPDPWAIFTWRREGDKFVLNTWVSTPTRAEIRIEIDQRTRAGSLVVREYDIVIFESQWTETGAGSWTEAAWYNNPATSGIWEPAG